MINLPGSVDHRPVIVKLDPQPYPHLVRNEAAMLRLAQRVGFTVPTWRLLTDAAGMDALVLSRFDRLSDVAPETAFDARPVEDAAQVMGLWPADKYNVTSEDLISSVSALTAAPAVTRLELFRRFVFALLTGNGDLHAKNVSVIQDATGRWQLAPYYDFPSTLLYDDLTLALPIQGRTDDISRKRLLAFADAISLPERPASRHLDLLLQATSETSDDTFDGLMVKLPFAASTLR